MPDPYNVAFAPWMVAGVRTQWDNMRPYLEQRDDLRARIVEIDPFLTGGRIERLPLVPATIKGTVRSMLCATPLFRAPRLDAVWIQDLRSTLPYALSRGTYDRTPLIFTGDSTSIQQAAFGDYYAKSPNRSLRGRVRDGLERFYLNRAAVLNPWSEWAARSMRDDYGVPSGRVRVIPPGVDLDRWPPTRHYGEGNPMRILFVGGDFERKGGGLLLDVFRQRLRDRCELHLVTRSDVPTERGVRVYRGFAPNDPALRALYASCDIFALPTRADCFSLASIEAMAAGLPVVTSGVGGIPEIVAEGESGFLTPPGDRNALAERLAALVDAPDMRARMGVMGRKIVEERFDAARNTRLLLDLIVDVCWRGSVRPRIGRNWQL